LEKAISHSSLACENGSNNSHIPKEPVKVPDFPEIISDEEWHEIDMEIPDEDVDVNPEHEFLETVMTRRPEENDSRPVLYIFQEPPSSPRFA
jgi:hypothetical protein